MVVDTKTIDGLSRVLSGLRDAPHAAIPDGVLTELAGLSKPGRHLRIDLEASERLGAPLILLEDRADDTRLLAPLTPRQRQVARLIILGRSNRDIARHLCITVATVKDHVHAVLERLDLPSRVALIAAAHSLTSE